MTGGGELRALEKEELQETEGLFATSVNFSKKKYKKKPISKAARISILGSC